MKNTKVIIFLTNYYCSEWLIFVSKKVMSMVSSNKN